MVTMRNKLHRYRQASVQRSADFRASTMRPLFEYGARCAQSGRLRTTMDETMHTVAAAAPASNRTPTVDPEVECPLRDVQLTAGDRR
jgi:hypothetical protein